MRSFFGFGDRPKNQSALPAKKRFSIWYFVLAMILFYYLQPVLFSSKVETISYSQFKQYVEQGIAGDLVIGPESINGTLTGSPKRSFANKALKIDNEADTHRLLNRALKAAGLRALAREY
jgi:cell division protease FtsH